MTERQPENSTTYESQISTERLVENLQHARQLLKLVNINYPGYVHKTELLVDDLRRDLEARGYDPQALEQSTEDIEGARSLRLS